MGIENLLKALSSIQIKKHISEYRGKRIAIDSYCWLHKSIYTTTDILDNPDSTKYLVYLQDRLNMLIRNGIIPVMIFDGDKLPMKKEEEADRERYI